MNATKTDDAIALLEELYLLEAELHSWVAVHVPTSIAPAFVRAATAAVLAIAPDYRDVLTTRAYHCDREWYRKALAQMRKHGRCKDWPDTPWLLDAPRVQERTT